MRANPWLLAVAAVLAVAPAAAQSTGQDVAAAQALFDEGKRLMQAGRYDEACPKLVESQRLDPGGGTLVAIALCHEAQGKTATAWGDFNLALSEAKREQRADREAIARDHLRALEQKLPRVRVVVGSKVAGLEVRRDGELVGEGQWGVALPIDPGEHRFDATAPGKTAWHGTVTVKPAAETTDVPIPPLQDSSSGVPTPPEGTTATPPVASSAPSPNPTTAPPSAATTAPVATTTPSAPPATSDGSTMRTWGFVVGGVALVSAGVGAVLGLAATGKWHDAQRACPNGVCTDPKSLTLGDDAGKLADYSTVFFTVGAVGIATSIVLLVLAPSDQPARTGVHASPMIGAVNGVSLGGRF